jgi:hypothetical protein
MIAVGPRYMERIYGAIHAGKPSMRIYGVIKITPIFYFLVGEYENRE